MPDLLDGIINGLRIRRWETLRDKWIPHIPLIKPAGLPPTILLSEVEDFKTLTKELIVSGAPYIRKDMAAIRMYALWEAVFLLHKASHVLSAAELHIKMGILTWSLSSAYQACFYAAKSLLNLLGVNIGEYNNKSVIVDLWPEPEALEKKHRNKGNISDTDIVVWKTNVVLDHTSIWKIFIRIISVLRIDIWPGEYIKIIKKMDVKDFAKQRNSIHYFNNRWLCDDLFEFIIKDKFGSLSTNLDDYFDESHYEHHDFTVVLCFIVTKMAYLLFKDITTNSKMLDDEMELFLSTIQEVRHPLYHNSLTSI